MTEAKCRYNPDTNTYTTPTGDTCDTPRQHHCQAKKGCHHHLAWGERTCARCLGDTRRNIRHIAEYAPLLDAAALESRSINSEAANLAGPACDVEAWSWRKVAAMQGRAWHASQDEDEQDSHHPFSVLTYWAWQTVSAYQLPEPDVYTIRNAAELLDKQLHRIAHDDDQDFRQFANEIKTCRSRLDSALAIRKFAEKGVPCPRCIEDRVRDLQHLVRKYPEYCRCSDTDCAKLHVADDSLDVWECPRNKDHWWSHKDYTNRLEERRASA